MEMDTRQRKRLESKGAEQFAVRWRLLDRTVDGIRNRNQDIPPEELSAIIDEAVTSVRSANRPKARPRTRK